MAISVTPWNHSSSTLDLTRVFAVRGLGNDPDPIVVTPAHARGKNTDSTDTKDTEGSSNKEAFSASVYNLNPSQSNLWSRRLNNVQTLLDRADYSGAAGALLNIDIEALPASYIDTYAELMDITADNLDERSTYLLSEMAGRQNILSYIQDSLNIYSGLEKKNLSVADLVGNVAAVEKDFVGSSFGGLTSAFFHETDSAKHIRNTPSLSMKSAFQGRAVVMEAMEALQNSAASLAQNLGTAPAQRAPRTDYSVAEPMALAA